MNMKGKFGFGFDLGQENTERIVEELMELKDDDTLPTERFKELNAKKRKTTDDWVFIAEELSEANESGKLHLYEENE
jgi:hypothetical protein